MKMLILAASVLLFIAAPAGAQGYNPPPTITVAPPNPAPGDLVRVVVTNCGDPGTVVTVRIDGVDVGTATLGPDGGFSERFRVPEEAEGRVAVTVECAGGNVLSSFINVVVGDLPFQDPDDDPDVGDGNLPRTGSSSTIPLAQAGAALLGVGTILVLAVARRRDRQPEPAHG